MMLQVCCCFSCINSCSACCLLGLEALPGGQQLAWNGWVFSVGGWAGSWSLITLIDLVAMCLLFALLCGRQPKHCVVSFRCLPDTRSDSAAKPEVAFRFSWPWLVLLAVRFHCSLLPWRTNWQSDQRLSSSPKQWKKKPELSIFSAECAELLQLQHLSEQ